MLVFSRGKMAVVQAAVGAFAVLLAFAPVAAQGIEVRTLSSRPDMVSGGNALVEITGAVGSGQVSVTLNGTDVSSAFRPGLAAGSLVGRVEGLTLGRNALVVQSGGDSARLELINHPLAGPIFSGPHQTPFICQTQASGLGAPLDAECNSKTVVTYWYRTTQPIPPGAPEKPPPVIPPGFKLYDPSAPRPADLAQTTTTEGKTVDFIVRLEAGTINRAIYHIAFLHKPGEPLPDPWTRTPGWNGRLVYAFGPNLAAGYHQGSDAAIVKGYFSLGLGYAIAGSSLNTLYNTSNCTISAETMMMVREHFIKQFGVPVHTIGWGNSGGAISQYIVAHEYPGLLDGIVPAGSFPDPVTIAPGMSDTILLDHAFSASGSPWTEEQKAAVSGFAVWKTAATWAKPDSLVHGIVILHCDKSIPKALAYNAVSNPHGARCDIYDNEVNIYGRNPQTGFARRPLDNVGVQYGLVAFNAGKITAEQFVELNEKVGGYDLDGNLVAHREVADPEALPIAYRTGRVNTGGGGLAAIPIIDISRATDATGNVHDHFRAFAIRARIKAANGNAANQVILTEPREWFPLPEILQTMDRWLDNISHDTAGGAAAAKVVRNKPSGLQDACWTEQGDKIVGPHVYDPKGTCTLLFPYHGDPRIAAGGPLSIDVLKCQLKPLDARDYAHPLTAAQMARLKAVFPQGVCDYSRPGVGKQPVQTWWKY